MLKRFLVFCFDTYYPNGGWNDFRSSHDTFPEAEEAATRFAGSEPYLVHWQVVDRVTGDVWKKDYR